MKNEILIGVALLCLLLTGCQGYSKTCPDFNYSAVTTELDSQDTISLEQYQELLTAITENKMICEPTLYVEGCEDTFENIAYTLNKARDYELDTFDCTEKAELLADVYKKLGWDSKVKRVNTDCASGIFEKKSCEAYDGRHDIVLVRNVYIEATSGKIINPQFYKGYGLK